MTGTPPFAAVGVESGRLNGLSVNARVCVARPGGVTTAFGTLQVTSRNSLRGSPGGRTLLAAFRRAHGCVIVADPGPLPGVSRDARHSSQGDTPMTRVTVPSSPAEARYCEWCIYWQPLEERSASALGQCRRYAPMALSSLLLDAAVRATGSRPDDPHSELAVCRWPITASCDWCGEGLDVRTTE